MTSRLTPADVATASTPLGLSLSLTQVNQLVGIAGGLIGIAFVVWQWRRAAKKAQ